MFEDLSLVSSWVGDWDRRKLLKKLGDALRFGEDCEDSSSFIVERDQPSQLESFDNGCGRGLATSGFRSSSLRELDT